jgi:uracil-DNA glycosylase family 4
MDPEAFTDKLNALRHEAGACQRCELYRQAKQPVAYRGDSNPDVLFVGQSPGEQEDQEGYPFVGSSGRMMMNKISELKEAHGFFPRHGFTNVAWHHPPLNAYRPVHGKTCAPLFLRPLIDLTSPKLIVAVGKDAATALMPLLLSIPTTYAVSEMLHPSGYLRARDRMQGRWDRDWNSLWSMIASLKLTGA